MSVEDSERNVPGTAAGARSVMVECLDRDGKVLIREAQAWPFADTDGRCATRTCTFPWIRSGWRGSAAAG